MTAGPFMYHDIGDYVIFVMSLYFILMTHNIPWELCLGCKLWLFTSPDISINLHSVCNIILYFSACTDYIPPELFNYKSKSGYTMHGMYYLPHNREPGKKYPTVLFVYGGPHAQLVSNTFKGLK